MAVDQEVLDDMFDRLSTRVTANAQLSNELDSVTERAGTAYTVRQYAFADRPLQIDGMTDFALAIITDGLDVSESTGNGTGVLCLYKPSPTDEWHNVHGNVAVTT